MAWTPVPDEFTIDDIGASLLANIAQGIYNHEAVLREYVQNACDAYADLSEIPEHASISIRIVGDDTITVQDNGVGMGLKEIKDSKKIAVSPKAGMDGRTGFRGIGIWAGLQACNKLEIETTRAGENHKYKLRINLGDIVQHLYDNINIKVLLDSRFEILQETGRVDDHYTIVKLIGLQGEYKRLTERQELERIVSQHLPCKIDPQFEHAERVRQFYHSLEDHQEFSILVEGGEVFKQFPAGLEAPEVATLERDGTEFGRVWYCSFQKSIVTREFQYRSFRLRVRNFAVGPVGIYDNEDGSGFGIVNMQKLGSSAHLNWHAGEIHITNPEVRPDTPRSGLELNSASRRAIEAVRSFYEDRIADSRARAEFTKYRKELSTIEEALKGESPIESETAKAYLKQLHSQTNLTRGAQPTDKIKKRVRALLMRPENKTKRSGFIAKLTPLVSAPAPAPAPPAPAPAPRPAPTPPPVTPARGPATPPPSRNGTTNGADYEQVLSDIIAIVEAKLGYDNELLTEVCDAIQNVFKDHGLIDA